MLQQTRQITTCGKRSLMSCSEFIYSSKKNQNALKMYTHTQKSIENKK